MSCFNGHALKLSSMSVEWLYVVKHTHTGRYIPSDLLQVQKINNEAAEISQNAEAQSTLIKERAKYNATAIEEQARSNGLKTLYSRLGN